MDEGGAIWTWGFNYYGQLGDNTTTDRHTPVPVHGEGDVGFLGYVIAAAAGSWHNVVVETDGTVRTWGCNYHGQIGDGTTIDRLTPVPVHGEGDVGYLSDITAIVAGANHTVALKTDGTVRAWGWNYHGQLGNGTWLNTFTTPVQVHGEGDVGFLSGIVSVQGGSHHTVALKSDGSVWAWGYNSAGQLGDGTTTERHTPVQVHGEDDLGFLTDVCMIRVGNYHNVALKTDGTVWAWGYNNHGQLGDGTTVSSSTPVQVLDCDRLHFSRVRGADDVVFLSDITAIAAGSYHTIALKSDSTVWTWGDNDNGQLGDGTSDTLAHSTPEHVHGEGGVGFLSDIIAISGGGRHTVALKSDSTVVWTWGDNEHGQLGDGSTTDSPTPVRVDFGSLRVAENTKVVPNHIFCSVSPNPFNSSVVITIADVGAGLAPAKIEIYDLQGKVIMNRTLQGADNEIIWQPEKSLGSGVYFVRARFGKLTDRGEESITKRVVYLK